MGHVTLYLDPETETKLKSAAKAAGVSQSRWVAALIQQKTASEWPASIARLAGAWADLPTVEELRQEEPEDIPREPFKVRQ
jgi:hypothetical protein